MPAQYKSRQKEEVGLAKKFLECRNKLKAEIDNIHGDLLTSESKNQWIVMEFQNQCGNNHLIEK